MHLPFTQEQFLDMFAAYNRVVWPVIIIMYVLAGLAVYGLFKREQVWTKVIMYVMSAMWMFAGAVYHIGFFSRINPVAFMFGAIFLFQGLVFFTNASIKRRLKIQATRSLESYFGGLFILYAAIIYPVLSMVGGHGWPRMPMFGIAPCPVTIFTFGMLLMVRGRVAMSVLLIPLAWSIIGSFAALSLGVREDIGLLVSGLAGTALIYMKNRRLLAEEALAEQGKQG
jgi:hypothetical protein